MQSFIGVGQLISSRHATQQLVFQQLALQYQVVSTQAAAAPAGVAAPDQKGIHNAIDTLIARGQKEPLSWLELYNLEAMIILMMDDERLRTEAWSIREEFRNLSTDEFYKAYLNSNPPADPRDSNTDVKLVRRDIENLLRKLHELRLGRSLLDVIRAYTTALTFGVTTILIVTTIVVAFFVRQGRGNFPAVLLVVSGGVFGAGLSMLQRLSQIPSKGDLIPRYPAASRRVVWILTPMLALVQGALAAISLYFIFRAGLLQGPLFPEFPPSTNVDAAASPSIAELLCGNINKVDVMAKLLVWSLVAGTAERLVPDLLSRLSDQANKAQFIAQKAA